MRLMVVGRTGAGKSSVANCILGKDRFQVGTGFRSTTTECQVDMVTRMGKRIRVSCRTWLVVVVVVVVVVVILLSFQLDLWGSPFLGDILRI